MKPPPPAPDDSNAQQGPDASEEHPAQTNFMFLLVVLIVALGFDFLLLTWLGSAF
jgi:hypothetical protein